MAIMRRDEKIRHLVWRRGVRGHSCADITAPGQVKRICLQSDEAGTRGHLMKKFKGKGSKRDNEKDLGTCVINLQNIGYGAGTWL